MSDSYSRRALIRKRAEVEGISPARQIRRAVVDVDDETRPEVDMIFKLREELEEVKRELDDVRRENMKLKAVENAKITDDLAAAEKKRNLGWAKYYEEKESRRQ